MCFRSLIKIFFLFIVQIIGHSTLAFLLWLQAQTVDLSNTASTFSFYLFIWKASVIDLFNLMCEFEIKFMQVPLFSSRLTSNYFVDFAVVLCWIFPHSLLTLRRNEGTKLLCSFYFFFIFCKFWMGKCSFVIRIWVVLVSLKII